MKFIPRNDDFVGRMVIKKSDSTIILTNKTKVTKFILIDVVGPGAAQKGLKAGDVVLVVSVRNMVLDAGRMFIPFAEEKDVKLFATDLTRDDLLVQKLNGEEFVPFDSPDAAPSFGAEVSV